MNRGCRDPGFGLATIAAELVLGQSICRPRRRAGSWTRDPLAPEGIIGAPLADSP